MNKANKKAMYINVCCGHSGSQGAVRKSRTDRIPPEHARKRLKYPFKYVLSMMTFSGFIQVCYIIFKNNRIP